MSRINHSLKLLHGLLCVCVCVCVGGVGTRAFFVGEGVPGHGGRGTVCVCVCLSVGMGGKGRIVVAESACGLRLGCYQASR